IFEPGGDLGREIVMSQFNTRVSACDFFAQQKILLKSVENRVQSLADTQSQSNRQVLLTSKSFGTLRRDQFVECVAKKSSVRGKCCLQAPEDSLFDDLRCASRVGVGCRRYFTSSFRQAAPKRVADNL